LILKKTKGKEAFPTKLICLSFEAKNIAITNDKPAPEPQKMTKRLKSSLYVKFAYAKLSKISMFTIASKKLIP